MTKKAKLAVGISAAILAGVVITLLVAPEKSKEVTKRIKKSAGKWVDKLGNVFSKVAEEQLTDVKQAIASKRNMVTG